MVRGEVFEPEPGSGSGPDFGERAAALIAGRCRWGKGGNGRHEVEDVVAVQGGGQRGGASVLGGVLEASGSQSLGGRYLVPVPRWSIPSPTTAKEPTFARLGRDATRSRQVEGAPVRCGGLEDPDGITQAGSARTQRERGDSGARPGLTMQDRDYGRTHRSVMTSRRCCCVSSLTHPVQVTGSRVSSSHSRGSSSVASRAWMAARG